MRYLSIHLTDLCNSECAFCVVGSPLYTKDSVIYDDVLSFLDQHRSGGYEAVNLHGGEPTIHPKFLATLQYIQDHGYPEVHLQTNAIKLADRDFVRQLVELRVTKFIISLHGDLAVYHDSQTCTSGGFERTIEGIRNVKSFGAHVRTNTVITIQNLERLTAITELACDLGVDHLNFSNLHPVGSARFSLGRIMPRFEIIRPHLYPAIEIAAERGRQVTLEGFPRCAVSPAHEPLHLTNQNREIKLLIRGQVIPDYDSFMRDTMSIFGEPCIACPAKSRCGGVYPEYIAYNGWIEFDPRLVEPDVCWEAAAAS